MQEILSKKDIGNRIKELRLNSGRSQAFMADILGLSRSNYSQIELGNQYPSFNTLYEIARYHTKSYDWLLHGTVPTPTSEIPVKLGLIFDELETTFKAFTTSLKKLEHELNQIKSRKYKAGV